MRALIVAIAILNSTYGIRSKAVEKLEDVKTGLISTRRIIFTPNVDVKEELKNTSIQITCLDEDGNVLKRVTSGDSGEIEDPRTILKKERETVRANSLSLIISITYSFSRSARNTFHSRK